ncbi:2-C-methyl-D-erythritol 2,4-cyclodiphosphate synthase [Oligoflexia bacterium]|nr:2-C-methyl-D-erythritol 2,4-cyclodiphosphate synthase [Oligoflexia bacterium]
MRIGLGIDSHRFITPEDVSSVQVDPSKPLIIGGVRVEGAPPFVAHSDGDVLYHSLFNAVASALGKKSIGHYFPDTSPLEENRSSKDYLDMANGFLLTAGLSIQNISIVIEGREPKVDPLVDRIKENLASIFGIATSQVGITATSGEELTPWGQGLGVQVTSTVILSE